MLLRQKRASDPAPCEITPEAAYFNRRALVTAALGAAAAAVVPGIRSAKAALPEPSGMGAFAGLKRGYRKLAANDVVTCYESITHYNNFYEFGTQKDEPAKLSDAFKPLPWTMSVEGLCAKPGTIGLEDVLRPHDLEERIYRHRCVEGWSMVIPWVGISLADVIKRFEPLGSAKFVVFETVRRPEQMPGQRSAAVSVPGVRDMILTWPYVDGLRLDEAMNPLAILAVGLYGKTLPNQNGAPVRLVVPWKYGFKSIKSIVRITFAEQQPENTWKVKRPAEYGFYANVNPQVDHPTHSQASERRIGAGGFASLLEPRRPTLLFNGYEEEVAHLYRGMDLVRNF
jgi:sulfoxide reductase catalytic subunit YedY